MNPLEGRLWTAPSVLCLVGLLTPAGALSQVELPGMQPEEGGVEFAKVQQCKMCHSKTDSGDADPYVSWQGRRLYRVWTQTNRCPPEVMAGIERPVAAR